GQDEDGDAVGQPRHRPGGALEEVVVGVQAVAAGGVGEGLGMSGGTGALERVSAEAHDPGEQELTGGVEGGPGESGGEGLDDGGEGRYHGPHGVPPGRLHSVRSYAKAYEEPLSFSPPEGRRLGVQPFRFPCESPAKGELRFFLTPSLTP